MAKLKIWWEARFLGLEFAVALLLTFLFIAWYYLWAGADQIAALLTNRGDVYGALAGVCGALLGFVITAVSIVLGYTDNDKLQLVMRSPHGPDLWSVFRSTMKVLAAATIAALLALIFDRRSSPVPLLLFIVFFTALLAAFRVARSIWVFEYIIRIVTAKPAVQAQPPVFPAPQDTDPPKAPKLRRKSRRMPVRRKTAA